MHCRSALRFNMNMKLFIAVVAIVMAVQQPASAVDPSSLKNACKVDTCNALPSTKSAIDLAGSHPGVTMPGTNVYLASFSVSIQGLSQSQADTLSLRLSLRLRSSMVFNKLSPWLRLITVCYKLCSISLLPLTGFRSL